MVRSKNPSGRVQNTDPGKARAEAVLVSESTCSERDEDTDPTMPIFFYMPGEDPYGIFCQWRISYFTLPKSSFSYLDHHPLLGETTKSGAEQGTQKVGTTGLSGSVPSGSQGQRQKQEGTVTFNCCEQYMMYSKALLARDFRSATLILRAPDPKHQKALGRRVSGFNEYDWSLVRQIVVEKGNHAKFMQNEAMKRVLLGTGERLLCEASRSDDVWGIGMDATGAIATWNALGARSNEMWGLNLLGKAIMAVRDRIAREMAGEELAGEKESIEGGIIGGRELMDGQLQTVGGKTKSAKEKRIRGLAKRVRDIEVLKERRDNGEVLQPNQIEKIAKEEVLRRELRRERVGGKVD